MHLTPKQQRFVDEYLIDLNATQAAIRAGYSAKTAQVIGAENLRKPLVSDAISANQNERSKSTKIDSEYVIKRLKREAELEGEGCSHSARVQALHLLGKHLDMFGDKLKVEGAVKLQIVEEIV
jgi:phage terminase small subunit